MASPITESVELIPGYFSEKMLGAGGYGEVWRVNAPGDIAKAIKLIYGYVSEERASRELKSLNRIKEVRHPFLLSLERIEIINNRLMIVTELADQSLMDRFNQCRGEDLPGVPRDELLIYLSDTADALDFMLDRHHLQHLDIKPDNLLLLGQHVKVADFGLVKEVVDQTHSMVNGMTPLYAAPELFMGQASPQSDQYSLAIVYQQMLTGELPFPGRTAAQLAVQHERARPRVDSLPESDRPVLLRALAKSPRDRFSSCGAFVQALIDAAKPVPSASGGAGAQDEQAHDEDEADTKSTNGVLTEAIDRVRKEQSLDSQESAEADLHSIGCTTPLRAARGKGQTGDTPTVAPSEQFVRHPPLAAELPRGGRPTLVIGIGGTGGRVLQKLKARLDRAEHPLSDALQMLLLDTDREAISAVRTGEGAGALAGEDVLPVPLRRPQDYRSQSHQLLGWLSRRWLYNIPPSLKTSGFRPLGRLAWVDQRGKPLAALRQRIDRLTSPAAIQSVEETTGGECRSQVPRIFIVGSISGGTASGMLLDVVAAVEELLKNKEVSTSGVCILLTFSTNRQSKEADLAVASAYAALSELRHVVCQPRNEEAGPRSACAYLVHMGHMLGNDEFDRELERLALYLYSDAVTPAGAWLDSCRDLQQEQPTSHDMWLRSFRLHAVGTVDRDLARQSARQLGARVVHEWTGDECLKTVLELRTRVQIDQTEDESDQDEESQESLFSKTLTQLIGHEFGELADSPLARELHEYICREVPAEEQAVSDAAAYVGLQPAIASVAGQLASLVADESIQPCLRELVQRGVTRCEVDEDPETGPARFGQQLPARLDEAARRLRVELLRSAFQSLDLWPEYSHDEELESQPDGEAAPGHATLPLTDSLRAAAQREIVDFVEQLGEEFSINQEGALSFVPGDLAERLDRVVTLEDGCGCAQRVLLMMPEKVLSNCDSLPDQDDLARRANVIASQVEEFVVCHELNELSLTQIAHKLVEGRPDIVEAALRLHTRKDVAWSELPTLQVEPTRPVPVAPGS